MLKPKEAKFKNLFPQFQIKPTKMIGVVREDTHKKSIFLVVGTQRREREVNRYIFSSMI